MVVIYIRNKVVIFRMNMRNLLDCRWFCNLKVKVDGNVVMILMVIKRDILLLILWLVICLFSYIVKIVFVERMIILES